MVNIVRCTGLPYSGFVLMGDLKFHSDNKSNSDAKRLNSILESYGLWQYFIGATHKSRHTLDVLISKELSCIMRGAQSLFIRNKM